jgi:TPR repeat protein
LISSGRQSADMGNDKAQLLYCKMLASGKGVRKNPYKAYDYMCQSAMNGNKQALERIKSPSYYMGSSNL